MQPSNIFYCCGQCCWSSCLFPQRWLQTRFPINLFPPIFYFPLYIYVAKAACESISGKFQTEKGKNRKDHIKNYSFVPEKTKLWFETCPGDDLVPGGRSERLWLLHVNSACSHSQGAGSFCQKNPLNSFKSFPSDRLPDGAARLDAIAGERLPRHEHLPTCLRPAGKLSLHLLCDLWKKSFFIFHFRTPGVGAAHSQRKVKPLIYCSLSIVSFLWKNSSAPFSHTTWKILPQLMGQRPGLLQEYQEYWATLCARWPHILHSDTPYQGGLGKLKVSHRFDQGQIFKANYV